MIGDELRMKFICEYCGKEFEESPSKRINKHVYCSKRCSYDAITGVEKSKVRVKVICKYCGDEYEVIQYREDRTSYCSLECFCTSQRGKGNPNWKGGISPYYNNDEIWVNIRSEALKRDDYTCQICGKERNLHVHHIIPYRLVGEHRITNLISLCPDCHRKLERNTYKYLLRSNND